MICTKHKEVEAHSWYEWDTNLRPGRITLAVSSMALMQIEAREWRHWAGSSATTIDA